MRGELFAIGLRKGIWRWWSCAEEGPASSRRGPESDRLSMGVCRCLESAAT